MASPATLPTGTVTFLFTDVEGSTRLLKQLGAAYGSTLARHHELVRAAMAARCCCRVPRRDSSTRTRRRRSRSATWASIS